jgi:hypothetical protein
MRSSALQISTYGPQENWTALPCLAWYLLIIGPTGAWLGMHSLSCRPSAVR